jgi:hypothetical protein
VSASPISAKATVARYQAELMQVAADTSIGLVLAGGGAWKEAPGAKRVVAFKDLRVALAQ